MRIFIEDIQILCKKIQLPCLIDDIPPGAYAVYDTMGARAYWLDSKEKIATSASESQFLIHSNHEGMEEMHVRALLEHVRRYLNGEVTLAVRANCKWTGATAGGIPKNFIHQQFGMLVTVRMPDGYVLVEI